MKHGVKTHVGDPIPVALQAHFGTPSDDRVPTSKSLFESLWSCKFCATYSSLLVFVPARLPRLNKRACRLDSNTAMRGRDQGLHPSQDRPISREECSELGVKNKQGPMSLSKAAYSLFHSHFFAHYQPFRKKYFSAITGGNAASY